MNQPTNQSINESTNQSINQLNPSINQSINQSINHSIIQSFNQSTNQLINQLINQLFDQETSKTISHSISQLRNQPVNEMILILTVPFLILLVSLTFEIFLQMPLVFLDNPQCTLSTTLRSALTLRLHFSFSEFADMIPTTSFPHYSVLFVTKIENTITAVT